MEVGSKEVVEGLLVWFTRSYLVMSYLHNVEFVPQLIVRLQDCAESKRKWAGCGKFSVHSIYANRYAGLANARD